MTTTSRARAIGTGILALVAIVLLGLQQPPRAPVGCEPDRRAPIARGLSYAEGFRAALVAQQAPVVDVARADGNVAATVALIEHCGWDHAAT